MSERDEYDYCNELERVGEQGPYALLEAAVKRIDEKDEVIRRQQKRIGELEVALLEADARTITYAYPKAFIVIDEIPPGFYEGKVMDGIVIDEIPPGFYEGEVMDEAPDTRDPDDYEDIQDYWNSLGYDSRP